MKVINSMLSFHTVCILTRAVSRSLAFHPTSKSFSKHSTVLYSSTSSSSSESTGSSTIVGADIEGPELPPIPSTVKRLFMVRHGEVINPGGDRPVYYGAMDVSLSPLGEDEARVRKEATEKISDTLENLDKRYT